MSHCLSLSKRLWTPEFARQLLDDLGDYDFHWRGKYTKKVKYKLIYNYCRLLLQSETQTILFSFPKLKVTCWEMSYLWLWVLRPVTWIQEPFATPGLWFTFGCSIIKTWTATMANHSISWAGSATVELPQFPQRKKTVGWLRLNWWVRGTPKLLEIAADSWTENALFSVIEPFSEKGAVWYLRGLPKLPGKTVTRLYQV